MKAEEKGAGRTLPEVVGTEHWATKRVGGENVRIWVWNKRLRDAASGGKRSGVVLFVHGSSMASTPVYDLQVPGRPEASLMDTFARLGYDTWCFDCEGYGRSDKHRDMNANVADGADDVEAVMEVITRETGQKKVMLQGTSSGALRAALYAQRHPERVSKIILDAFVWTGEGSTTLADRKKGLAQYRAQNRRPIDRQSVEHIFTRDEHTESAADRIIIQAYADAILALDDSIPTGTYLDMSANLPVVDPEKILVPTLIMRGQWDGIASDGDIAAFFAKLPNPDKQLTLLPGVAHSSVRSKNWEMVYDLMDAWLGRPAPLCTGFTAP